METRRDPRSRPALRLHHPAVQQRPAAKVPLRRLTPLQNMRVNRQILPPPLV